MRCFILEYIALFGAAVRPAKWQESKGRRRGTRSTEEQARYTQGLPRGCQTRI
jgi:hypothetical protein